MLNNSIFVVKRKIDSIIGVKISYNESRNYRQFITKLLGT